MKKISFTKMSGAGNDFILLDGNHIPGVTLTAESVAKLCARGTGIGSDGLLVVKDDAKYDFNMAYFNSDGSTGTLCGNGARCAIKYAYLSGRVKGNTTSFCSNDIVYSGEVLNSGQVKFNLGLPKDFKFNFKINAAGQQINASFVNTGSPHAVVKIGEMLKNEQDT
ncbi:MAG: diaminopimelate epimerase, partial [Syntrophothermus sp.]